MMLTKWDKRFLRLAREVATWSKDPSTQVGCVIAQGKKELALGYNGFPECIEDKPEWYEDRELKLSLVNHAEKNARNKVERSSDLVGATIYTWPLAPCGECAKDIVSWGITRIIAPKGRDICEKETEHVVKHCIKSYSERDTVHDLPIYIQRWFDPSVTYYWCDPSEIDE
jgi:dCMP deaminase